MAKKSGSLDYWRSYFRTANSSIFEIIDHAIMVAASDRPKEFRLRRDRIAEKLFSCRLRKCCGCERVELSVPWDDDDNGGDDDDCDGNDDGDGDSGDRDRSGEFEAGASKESKANSSRDDDRAEEEMNHVSNFSYLDAEALTDEIEEESQIRGEVLRIKEILQNREEESESVLFGELRRLQFMALTVDTLKETEIGKAVNRFRKHGSKEIRHLARTLIDGWKDMVDEWVNTTAAIATMNSTEGTPDSINPSVLDEEEGLPSPPLDEGAFFATEPTSMELSRFFDGMDDDGNPRNSGAFTKNRDNGRKPSIENQNVPKQKQKLSTEANVLTKEHKVQQQKKQEGVMKTTRPTNTDFGPGRPPRISTEQKLNSAMKSQQKPDRPALQRRPLSVPQDKLKSSDEVAVQVKLEATKRKLQERYQQAENAKRQRTIQVMELHDLPKQGLGHRNPHMKPGNHNRHWGHGRR
ncbi:hypothetical protein L484_004632 [Morus notabilis]|uniref:TFIIS N-terminal domain-containing protein n=1 Tax=Morus notabilis TaxID=981085 RepID=W9QXU9_9ROSA|nr:probable mediator of RNA polymerase II transcription subunit 26b [Morus notabilis]EXB43778.1 hypothetical protein L484_004632 [Morus notabilis]